MRRDRDRDRDRDRGGGGEREECGNCGGSGGGPTKRLRCRACGGSGLAPKPETRTEPEPNIPPPVTCSECGAAVRHPWEHRSSCSDYRDPRPLFPSCGACAASHHRHVMRRDKASPTGYFCADCDEAIARAEESEGVVR